MKFSNILKYLPHLKRGRSYKVFLESSESGVQITTTDIPEVDVDGGYLVLPHDFIVTDVHAVYHITTASSDTSCTVNTLRMFKEGNYGVALAGATHWDYADIYVSGYYE